VRATAEILRNSALADFPSAADLTSVIREMSVAQQSNDREAFADALQRAVELIGGINNAQVEEARRIAIAKKLNMEDIEEEEEEEEEKKSSQAPSGKKSSGRKAHKDQPIPDDVDQADFNRHTVARRKEFLLKKGLLPKAGVTSLEMAETFRQWREANPIVGQGLRGKGIGRKIIIKTLNKKTKIKKPIELSEGYEAPKLYKQLGRYLIGTYHLANNIACIKRPNINKSLLNKHISSDLVAILRKLIRKENPSFDELNKLSSDDKEVLHKVVKLCVLDISVPKPDSEADMEKELQRFDILKGEIMAGNDNLKLIKEFKALLMKLVHANRVSRKDAHDILLDLAADGK
jgi:predicted GNAT family N-acyltransferase